MGMMSSDEVTNGNGGVGNGSDEVMVMRVVKISDRE